MNDLESTDENELIRRAATGDATAIGALLVSQRPRLKRMIAARLDPRIAGRVDPSDVVQEVLTRAAVQLPEYLRQPAMPFYPWLRQLAWNQLVDLQRRHVGSKRRSVLREEWIGLNDQSTFELAKRLACGAAGPGSVAVRRELVQRLHAAMAQLPEVEREVLILKYLEQLTSEEAAAVLKVSQRTVQIRHRRALLKLDKLLNNNGP